MPQSHADLNRELADSLLDGAEAIREYISEHRNTLNDEDLAQLKQARNGLRDLSNQLTGQAIGLTLDDMQEAIENLKTVTAGVRTVLQKISDTRRAMVIAASLFGFASAIVAGNPNGIFTALKASLDLVRPSADG